MKGKIKVNLRSLNLRDDIFHSKYESSETRLSNMTELRGAGRNAKYQSTYVQKDKDNAWNNFGNVTQANKMRKRSGQQYEAIRLREFSPNSNGQEPSGFYWNQSRLGASVDMSGLAASVAKGQSNRLAKKRALVNQSVEVGARSNKNSSAFGRHDQADGAGMDRILNKTMTKRTENSGSDHDDERLLNPVAAQFPSQSTTKYRVIYTKKGKNRSRTIDAHEMVLQPPSDGAGEDEVNQAAGEASLNYYVHNADADKLETAKFQNTLSAFPAAEGGRPILVNTGYGEPAHGALGTSSLKAPHRKQIGLKQSQYEASENTKTASAQKSERSRLLESAALNEQASFTSNERKELLELQKIIANAATPAASGDQDKKYGIEAGIPNKHVQNSPPHHQLLNAFPITQQNPQYHHLAQPHTYNQDLQPQNLLIKATPRGTNVFDQDQIKMNQQLLQQSPGLEDNLQIRKMQMNQYIHPKSILVQQVVVPSQMPEPGETKDQNIGNDLSQPSYEAQLPGQSALYGLNQIGRRSAKKKLFLSVANTEDEGAGTQESQTPMKSGVLKVSQATRETAYDRQQADTGVDGGTDSHLGANGNYGAGVKVKMSDPYAHSQSKQQPASGNLTQLQQLRQFQRNQQILEQLEASHSAMSENWQLVVGNLREGLGDHESSYKTIVNENGGDSIQSMTGLAAVQGVELKTNSKRVESQLITEEDQHKARHNDYAQDTLVITAQRLSDESPGQRLGAEAKAKGQVCLDNGGVTTTRMDKSSKGSLKDNVHKRFNEESPSPALQKMDLQIEQIITQRKKQYQRQNRTDLNQSKNIFFQQQQQQLENLQELKEFERQRAFREGLEQQQQVRAPTEFRKSNKKLAGKNSKAQKLSRSLNPAKMKYYIGKALHNMSKTAHNEGIFGRQIKCSSQLHQYRQAVGETRRQSIQARLSSEQCSEDQRALSAQTKRSDEGKEHIRARMALQPNGAPDDLVLGTPKTGSREKTGDLCKRILTVQVGDGSTLGRRTGQMSRELASGDGTVHTSQQHFSSPAERAGSLHMRPSEDNKYSPDVHSATQKPPGSQTSQAPTQGRLKELNNSPYDQVQDASPGILDSILVEEPQTTSITQYVIAQQNRIGSQASRQMPLPEDQETMHIKSQVQQAQQSRAIGSVEVGKISTNQMGGKGEGQYPSAQSMLRMGEKQYGSYQLQSTKKAGEQLGGAGPRQSAILEVVPASPIAERDARLLYSTLKDYSHHYPQNFVTLMEDSQQERDYSILQNSLNQSLAQALKNEPFRKLLRPDFNKDYVQRVHQLVSGRAPLDGQARITHADFRHAGSQLQSRQEKERKSKAGTVYDSSVMKYLSRSIDVDSSMQRNHYNTIHSNFMTGRSSKLSEPPNAVGRSHHIRNQFMSKQKRIQKNDFNRSLNVASIKNDIHSQVSRISNEELIQQQIDLLPNFGLYQTRAGSARRYAAGTIRRKSKERSPVEAFEETGKSFFSKPKSPESTQNSVGGPRKKRTALHCQKPHEVDAVLQQIRNLQQAGERVRYEYAMSRFEQAEDAMRPGSKTQTQSIRLETAHGIDDPDVQAPGAGTMPARRSRCSEALVAGAGEDGDHQGDEELDGRESAKNSLHDQGASQDTLNQEKQEEKKAHHIPTQSHEEPSPQRVPTCQSPSMTLQNEEGFAVKRDGAVLAGANGDATGMAIEVAQATEARTVRAEDQQHAAQALQNAQKQDKASLNAGVHGSNNNQLAESNASRHKNPLLQQQSKQEGGGSDPRGLGAALPQLPSQVPEEQSEALMYAEGLKYFDETHESALHQMLAADHFTSDPQIGFSQDGNGKNAVENATLTQNTRAPGDADGVIDS